MAQQLAVTLAHLREAAELYRQLAKARRDQSEGSRRGADLAALDAEYAGDQADLARARAQRAAAAAELEQELQRLEDRLRDRRACRPSDASTQDAILRDVAAMRARRDQIEQELLDLWQDRDQAADSEAAQARRTIAGRQEEQAVRRAQGRNAEAEIVGELKHLLGKLPTRVARQLDRASARIEDPIATLTMGACGGCGYSMPPQDAINADRETELVTCQGCGRYVVARSGRRE